MKTLILKERKVLFYYNLLTLLMTYLMSIPYAIFRSEDNFDLALIIILGLSIYINLQSSLNQGIISNDDILLASMPIDRNLIVKSKYVSVLLMNLNSLVIFIIGVLLSMSTFYSGNNFFEIINIWKILVSTSIILFFISLTLLTYYLKKGVNKKKKTSLDVFVYLAPLIYFIAFMWKGREATSVKNILLKLDNPLFVLFIFAISLLLYFISYLLSARQYRKAEFN